MSMIVVDPDSVSLIPGRTEQLSAVKLDADGQVQSSSGFEWSVDDPTLARVSDDGEVLALKAGIARVFASRDGITGESQIHVVLDLAIDVVQISPSSLSLGVGDVSRLSAKAFNGYGEEVVGGLEFWSSSDASVASVDSSGLVTAGEAGTAEISVEIGATQSTIEVVVV